MFVFRVRDYYERVRMESDSEENRQGNSGVAGDKDNNFNPRKTPQER
jgi:hypothetical protein